MSLPRIRKVRTLFIETCKTNKEIHKILEQYLVISDEKEIMFGDEVIKSPGQLGLKVMQVFKMVLEKENLKIDDLKS